MNEDEKLYMDGKEVVRIRRGHIIRRISMSSDFQTDHITDFFHFLLYFKYFFFLDDILNITTSIIHYFKSLR